MPSHWFAAGGMGVISALVIAAPASAASLQTWWFNPTTNQLVFTTSGPVQPQAQLVFNPTRIVIDLPNTTLASGSNSQALNGPVQVVRAGQFERTTARLVIELAPNYSVDPQRVRVQGLSNNRWVVQLPDLQADGDVPTPEDAPPTIPPPSETANQIQGQTGQGAPAILNGVVATGGGFLLRFSGQTPTPEVELMDGGPDNRQLRFTLPETAIAAGLTPQELPEFRYSVEAWRLEQQPGNPPTTVVTLDLGRDSPEWRTLISDVGIIVLPPIGTAIATVPDQPPPTIAVTQPPNPTPIPLDPNPTPPGLEPVDPGPLPQIPQGRSVVVLDPGHGGRDPGAVGINGLQEISVIFPISLRVQALLEAQGVTVVMTRSDNRTLDLQTRVDIAERAGADIFVSIHANAISLSRPDVNGIETYYASSTGRRLADIIHASMLAATTMNDRGVKQARFYVIRRTSMPATLLEVGFVTGAQDYHLLVDPVWRETMATAIARGILQYLQRYG